MPVPELQPSQSPPPIPPVPPTAGAATGSQGAGAAPAPATAAGQSTREMIENAVNEAQQAAQGQAVTVQPPRIVRVSPDIPPEVIPIIAIVFGSVAFMVVFGPITRGIMRMIERRQENNLVSGPAIAHQLQALQQSVDTMAIELERISESQRFQSKLMNERAALPPKSGSV